MSSAFLTHLSEALGWCYFLAWSISFWPQAVLNYQRKSVTGLSFEFLAYNVTGFVLYSTYSTVKYFVPNGCDQTVQINDLAFGYHAVLMTAVTIAQCLVYRTERQRVHPVHAFVVAALWLLTAYTLVLCFLSSVPLLPACTTTTDADGTRHSVVAASFTLIDFMGWVKAFISFIKYTPQAYLNYRRQSTVGWSITNILLDLTGGTLSFCQQMVDSVNAGTTDPLFGNVPKLLLALESVAFDVLFIVQHYCLYNQRDHKDGEEPLVDGAEAGGEDGGADTDEGEGGEGGERGGADGEQVEGAARPSRGAAAKKKAGSGAIRAQRVNRSLRLPDDGGFGGHLVDEDRAPSEVVGADADDAYEPGYSASSSSSFGSINHGAGLSSFSRAPVPQRGARGSGGGGGSPRLAILDRYSSSGIPGGQR